MVPPHASTRPRAMASPFGRARRPGNAPAAARAADARLWPAMPPSHLEVILAAVWTFHDVGAPGARNPWIAGASSPSWRNATTEDQEIGHRPVRELEPIGGRATIRQRPLACTNRLANKPCRLDLPTREPQEASRASSSPNGPTDAAWVHSSCWPRCWPAEPACWAPWRSGCNWKGAVAVCRLLLFP